VTPFGAKMRELRAAKGVALKDMAATLEVSAAYLSALEHGHRGRPSRGLLYQIAGYFNLDWNEQEEVERLVDLSHPRVVVDTSGLSPKATELANRLAAAIRRLTDAEIEEMLRLLARTAAEKEKAPFKE
jgi:transcriptional regulator with XRE-family HTH domain